MQNNAAFVLHTRSAVYPTIPYDATPAVCSHTKTVHKLMWHYLNLHEAVKRSFRSFIIDVVEYTWIRELRNAETIYTNVTNKALVDHLQLCCGGLHVLDVINLTSDILTYYGEAVVIPEYINMIEGAQKKYQLVQLPVPNVTLMAISAKSILQAQAFIPNTK